VAVAPTVRVLAHDVTVFKRQWQGFVFSAFVQPLLYLAAMGVGLGSYVDKSSGSVGGVSYLEFVAPGLLAAIAFQSAVGHSLWPVMGGWKWDKRYLAMLATPITPAEILDAHVAWEVLLVGASSVVFLLVAAALGGIASWWALFALPLVLLLAAAVTALLSALSAHLEEDRLFPVIMRVGVLPLFLFSGTFFPTSQLPGGVRLLAPISPLYHGVEVARAAMTGHARSAGALVLHVAVLLGVFFVGRWLARREFTRRLSA
jgi:lipooligosaccharide transport system permease protein